MAGFIVIGDNLYNGTLKVATAAVKPGTFVAPSWSAGTCAATTANTAIAWFVANESDKVDEELVDDLNYSVAVGKYAKLKRLMPGEVFITDQVTGTVNVGDVVDVGDGAKIKATSGSPAQTFTCVEKPTRWGVTVYKCVVNN